MMSEQRISHYRGALLGLAAGDALGTTLEFKPPGSFAPVTDIVGGGPFCLKAGQWTDDTSLALCLAESLTARQGFNPVDQLKRYVLWWRRGYLSSTGTCFDIGNTTRQALTLFENTGNPWCGPTDSYSAGNGSIMRLAPVPLFYARQPHEAIRLSGESSRTTHGARAAVDGCRYLGALIAKAVDGMHKDKLLDASFGRAISEGPGGPLCPEIAEVAEGSFKRKHPPEIRGTGYVAQSLEAALWAFYHDGQSFKDGALMAVNLGDDADTTGAVYGQLAGAYYGEASIPKSWRDKIALRQLVEYFAEFIYRLAWESPSGLSEEVF